MTMLSFRRWIMNTICKRVRSFEEIRNELSQVLSRMENLIPEDMISPW
jgi:hypothetical protein